MGCWTIQWNGYVWEDIWSLVVLLAKDVILREHDRSDSRLAQEAQWLIRRDGSSFSTAVQFHRPRCTVRFLWKKSGVLYGETEIIISDKHRHARWERLSRRATRPDGTVDSELVKGVLMTMTILLYQLLPGMRAVLLRRSAEGTA